MLIKVRLSGSAWHGSQRCVRNLLFSNVTVPFAVVVLLNFLLSLQLVDYLTGNLNVSVASVFHVAFENQQTSKTVVKSCVELSEYFYNFVSYSDDELLSCFSIVLSFCFVFFSVFAQRDEGGILGFFGTTFV